MKLRPFFLLLSVLLLIACQPAPKNSPASSTTGSVDMKSPATPANKKNILGTWYIEYIGDRPVVDHSPARIQFMVDGAINGNASCNRFFGSYTYLNQQLTIPESLGATKMMCLPALMEQEQRLFEHLPLATQASVDNGLLILRDDQGAQIIKASRDESQ